HLILRSAPGFTFFPYPTLFRSNRDQPLDTLILNGAECEPCISCDDMLMRERADEVISGARIMLRALHARHCLVAVEDNKPEAARSEEHTSELQSRENLVCRLLR